ncbi:hypothetical protein CHS0354_025815 [Potamilus streckersoni]|uniref:Uncharacterized protein n=1 Tax=Potamilus streckersoni TaxID=2493646 RepID=A0AAE0W8H1_9BIVA|nr:hypothetical protein CHS0354_025815 [Potamilus streckersoni]
MFTFPRTVGGRGMEKRRRRGLTLLETRFNMSTTATAAGIALFIMQEQHCGGGSHYQKQS